MLNTTTLVAKALGDRLEDYYEWAQPAVEETEAEESNGEADEVVVELIPASDA